MATGPRLMEPAGPSPHELGEDDLRVVFKALHSVAEKYIFLGVEMNIKMNEIASIQKQCSNPKECLLNVLSLRLKQIPSLTWRDIDSALRSDTVGEAQLADRIRKLYGHLYSQDPSFEVSLDQGRKMSEIPKSKKAKKEKSARNYTQQDSNEEVCESERCRNPSEKLQINVNKAVLKQAKNSPHKKRHSKPENVYERETRSEGKTKRKKNAIQDKEREVVCSSRDRHKVKYSEQRAQEVVLIQSESDSSASSSEEQIIQVNNSDSTEETYSSEQGENSAEEVSEKERYQKPSEQPREDEYPHCYREPPETKMKGESEKSYTLLSKKKHKVYESRIQHEGKRKRNKKAVDPSVNDKVSQHEMASNARGQHKRFTREREKFKQKKSEKEHSKKGVQKVPRENESESSMRREEEILRSSCHKHKPKSSKDTHHLKLKTQGKEVEYQTTAKKGAQKIVKGNIPVAKEQSSDEQVKGKPAPTSLKLKEVPTKSESEDEHFFASTSDKSELLHESTIIKGIAECHKVYPNADGNKIDNERAVREKKKAKVMNQKGFRSFDRDIAEQSNEGKRSIKVTKKDSKQGKNLKADSSPSKEREEREELAKEIEQDTPPSDHFQEDPEDEESDLDDSSGDEQDGDSEQKSSNKDEETEADDESFTATSEEEVKQTSKKSKPGFPFVEKEIGERKEKGVKIAADVRDQSAPSGKCRGQEEHDIQPDKRSRRRHRESSMSPSARGGSSPSTSQEENQRRADSKEQRRKIKKGKDHKKIKGKAQTKTEKGKASDSSPECDRLSESDRPRINVFERFYGQLCCEISNPVETAAQLQKKGLITKAVIKDMMRSPESQQEKIINLVDMLDEIVKSKPDFLFMISEVLLESDTLQKVGSEILAVASK